MLSSPSFLIALSLLSAGGPAPLAAAPSPPPSKLADRLDTEELSSTLAPPPAREPNLALVSIPALIGVGFGVTSLLFYKVASDQATLLDKGVARSRGEALQYIFAGTQAERWSALTGGASLVCFGLSAYFAFAPQPAGKPAVSVAPVPGGGVAVVGGHW